jgi:hypothetical protein
MGGWLLPEAAPTVSFHRLSFLAAAAHSGCCYPPRPLPPQAAEYRPLLTTLFSRYVDPCLDYCRRNFKTVVPLPAVNQVGPPLRARLRQAMAVYCVNKPRFWCQQGGSLRPPNLASAPPLCSNPDVSPSNPPSHKVMTICKILEGILPKESVRGAPPPDKKLLEYHFVFACIWAFGGCMMVDKVRARPYVHE